MKPIGFTQPNPQPTPIAGSQPARTVGRRWKARRNLVILIASREGVSQRILADVFDLAHSRIAAILKEFETKRGPGSPHGPKSA